MGNIIPTALLLSGMMMSFPIYSQYSRQPDSPRDTITLHPGWPIHREGKNERGGIYCNLDQDDDLEIVYTVGNFVYAFNKNGSEVAGWPQELNYPTDGVAAFGDIDGDGYGEIVVTTHQPTSYNDGKIYAFRRNGSYVTGFPITTEGGPLRSPVLADINMDGKKEIVVAIRRWPEGFINIYRGTGTMLDGWPQRLDYIPASEVAVGDITGDGNPEIIAESYYSLNVFTPQGPMMPGFPFTPGEDRVLSYSAPVLADIDDDGQREIIFGDHSISSIDGRVYILKSDGTHFPNWPRNTGSGIYAPPAVGDIDGDGTLDVAVGEYGFSTDVYKLYAWNGLTGEFLPGFPINGLNSINNQIILADLDGDGQIELMFDDNTSAGVYPGYNHDGTPMDGWPLHVNGSTFYINPFVADLDGDGYMEISGGGYVPDENRTYLYLWQSQDYMNEDLAILPVFQYNTRHNGVTGDKLMVDTDEISSVSPSRMTALSIFPNPASDHTLVEAAFRKSGSAVLDLYTAAGQKVATFTSACTSGEMASFHLSTAGLENGFYPVRVSLDDEILTGKIFIIRQ